MIHEVHRMYVCCCNAVTDREVAEAIAGGARSRADVTRACGAGGDCGACHATIEGMIDASAQPAQRQAEPVTHAHGSHAPHAPHTTHTPHAPHLAGTEAAPALLPAAALVRGRAA